MTLEPDRQSACGPMTGHTSVLRDSSYSRAGPAGCIKPRIRCLPSTRNMSGTFVQQTSARAWPCSDQIQVECSIWCSWRMHPQFAHTPVRRKRRDPLGLKTPSGDRARLVSWSSPHGGGAASRQSSVEPLRCRRKVTRMLFVSPRHTLVTATDGSVPVALWITAAGRCGCCVEQ